MEKAGPGVRKLGLCPHLFPLLKDPRQSVHLPESWSMKWGGGNDGGHCRSAGQSCLVLPAGSPYIIQSVLNALPWDTQNCVRIVLHFTDMSMWLTFLKDLLLFCRFLTWKPITFFVCSFFQNPDIILKAFENRGGPRHGRLPGLECHVVGLRFYAAYDPATPKAQYKAVSRVGGTENGCSSCSETASWSCDLNRAQKDKWD